MANSATFSPSSAFREINRRCNADYTAKLARDSASRICCNHAAINPRPVDPPGHPGHSPRCPSIHTRKTPSGPRDDGRLPFQYDVAFYAPPRTARACSRGLSDCTRSMLTVERGRRPSSRDAA